VAKEVGVTPEVAKHDMGDYDFISLQDQLGENWLGSAGKPGRVADVLKRTADFLVEQKSIRSAPCRRGVPGGDQHDLPRAGDQGLTGTRSGSLTRGRRPLAERRPSAHDDAIETLAASRPRGVDAMPASSPEGSFVRFAGVSVSYPSRDGPIRALDTVDLAFSAGDFICVVGPSGCGKTTMMQTLAGFIAPTSGSITVDGGAGHRARPGPGCGLPAASPVPLDDSGPQR
jgi:ABC-type multidrug transport system fused ATPase/permease subunit